jgi:hypothetical protein
MWFWVAHNIQEFGIAELGTSTYHRDTEGIAPQSKIRIFSQIVSVPLWQVLANPQIRNPQSQIFSLSPALATIYEAALFAAPSLKVEP